MLGFSLPKIFLLFLIIVVIWYGFKLYERFLHQKNNLSKKRNKNNNDEEEIEALNQCPVCGNYFEKDSPKCDNVDCPY